MWHCGTAIFFKSAGFHALRIMSIVWFILQLVDDVRNLVNALPRVVCVCIFVFRPKMPPLKAIYRPKISFLTVRQPHAVQKLTTTIAVPYFDSLFRKRFRRRGFSRELEQFCDDGAKTRFVVRRVIPAWGLLRAQEMVVTKRIACEGANMEYVPVPVLSNRCSPFSRMSRMKLRYWYSSC